MSKRDYIKQEIGKDDHYFDDDEDMNNEGEEEMFDYDKENVNDSSEHFLYELNPNIEVTNFL